MNADNQVVPIVEEDQGEGWEDLLQAPNNTIEHCIKCKQQFVRKVGNVAKSPKREFLCDWCKRQQNKNWRR